MAQKKQTTRTTEKKAGVKVQDLAPKKDAKGGIRYTSASGKKESANAPRPLTSGSVRGS